MLISNNYANIKYKKIEHNEYQKIPKHLQSIRPRKSKLITCNQVVTSPQGKNKFMDNYLTPIQHTLNIIGQLK